MQEPTAESGEVLDLGPLAVLVGGGDLDTGVLDELMEAGGLLVGVDGGADAALAAGHKAELVIGDLDSLGSRQAWEGQARVMHVAEQLTTDFQKALYSTRADVTIALGMMGRRLDHSLAAIDALRRVGDRRVILVDADDMALSLAGPFGFSVAAGERVSLHPLAPVRFVRSEGLLWPLDGLTLAPGLRDGSSNAATEGPFFIDAEPGAPWLLIVDRRHLMRLVESLLGVGR